jgi:hypothetical protein
MKFFKRKIPNPPLSIQTVPSRDRSHPFGDLNRYTPLSSGEFKLYQTLRESVPIIDAAICKIVRLVGGFKVISEDANLQKELNHFLANVQVNSCEHGLESFIGSFLEQLLTHGTAVGEMIPDACGKTLSALYNVPLENIELRTDANPLKLQIFRRESSGKATPIKFPELILTSALNPIPGKIFGTSILKGLPFVSTILLKIYNSIGINWERIGNIRFAVTYKPGPNASDQAFAKERVMHVANQWQKAMHSSSVSDFVSIGDVSIKVIGADNQVLDSQIPVRQMLEQITAKLSIPPFLLGLSWSTSEKMSTQQADILTSELESYRRLLKPVILKICSTWMHLNGYFSDFNIIWNCINLQDEVELARARLLNARAEEIEQKHKSKLNQPLK